jgi:hypothetical protein
MGTGEEQSAKPFCKADCVEARHLRDKIEELTKERDAAQSRTDRAIHIIDHGKNFVMRRVREVLSGAPKGKDQEPLVRPDALKAERDAAREAQKASHQAYRLADKAASDYYQLAHAIAGERDSALAREAQLREALEAVKKDEAAHVEARPGENGIGLRFDTFLKMNEALSTTSLTADAWRKQIEDGARRKALEEALRYPREQLAELEAMIAKGKGEWPKDGYSWDTLWNAWHERASAFRSVISYAKERALSTPPTQAEES